MGVTTQAHLATVGVAVNLAIVTDQSQHAKKFAGGGGQNLQLELALGRVECSKAPRQFPFTAEGDS